MTHRTILPSVLLAAMLVVAQVPAAGADQDRSRSPQEAVAIAESLSPSLVQVGYTLQQDEHGEEPSRGRWLIEQEQRMWSGGYLVAPRTVVTHEIDIHPRFIRSIAVAFDGREVEAEVAGYLLHDDAVLLELSETLEGTRPLEFDADAEASLRLRYHRPALWQTTVGVVPTGSVSADEGGAAVIGTKQPGCGWVADCELMLTADGTPVGLNVNGRLPIDGSWKGSPLDNPVVTADEYAEMTERIERLAEQSVLKVRLNFRSPRRQTGRSPYLSRYGRRDEDVTELHALGVVVGEHEVMVLHGLSPRVTARLERVTLYPGDAEPVEAEFVCSYEDYSALLVETSAPLAGALSPAEGDLMDHRDRLLPAVEVEMKGDQRIAHLSHRRLTRFSLGWRDELFPRVDHSGDAVLVFDADGNLVTLPVARRPKGQEQHWRSEQMLSHPAARIWKIIREPEEYADASNVPLTEDEEARLAWLGVVLQSMDAELARANNVSHLTEEGRTGGMVSWVYPDSPAAEAGIEPGDILLRLDVEGEPRPVPVRVEERGFMGEFPWDHYDDLPEEYYDQVPTPWQPQENWLTRTLTEFGFFKGYTVELWRGDEVIEKEFQIVQSPPHYDLAPRHRSDDLGVTVREMTFEVRRYFQRTPEDPGLIVSRVEPGSAASVAGIKPYEIITHVDDREVRDVDEFAEIIERGGELRLSVRRMHRGRVVKVQLDEPEPRPDEDEPAEPVQPDAPTDQPAPTEAAPSASRSLEAPVDN